jgi:hypothetical protein
MVRIESDTSSRENLEWRTFANARVIVNIPTVSLHSLGVCKDDKIAMGRRVRDTSQTARVVRVGSMCRILPEQRVDAAKSMFTLASPFTNRDGASVS